MKLNARYHELEHIEISSFTGLVYAFRSFHTYVRCLTICHKDKHTGYMSVNLVSLLLFLIFQYSQKCDSRVHNLAEKLYVMITETSEQQTPLKDTSNSMSNSRYLYPEKYISKWPWNNYKVLIILSYPSVRQPVFFVLFCMYMYCNGLLSIY